MKKRNRRQAKKAAIAQAYLADIKSEIKAGFLNATRQLEAYLNIQQYLLGEKRLPTFHGWPVSPDFGLQLIEFIETNRYDLIIEFGSGTSTLLIAKAISKFQADKEATDVPEFISIEHDPLFLDKTAKLIQIYGVDQAVALLLCELVPYHQNDGTEFMHYDTDPLFNGMRERFNGPEKSILVVVDGPPAATCYHARYPALPKVLSTFPESNIDVLLDDYIRIDEQEIVSRWLSELAEKNIETTHHKIPMEKDAYLIQIRH